jgi:germination protein, Ger(x)C family
MKKNHFGYSSVRIICLILFFCLLGGCWDAKDLANLAIVEAVGIDCADQPGKLTITIQVVKPGEVKSGGGGGDTGGGGGGEQVKKEGQAFLIVHSTGKTVSEAFRNFAFRLNRELYLSDNQIIIFGQAAAEKGVRPLLDYFIRTREPREIAWILVANGKASDVLEARTGMEKIPAMEITSLIENRNMTSQATGVTQQEFINWLMSKASSPYASLVEIIDEPKQIQLIGTAVFKADKYIGRFDKTETRGLLWVLGKVVRGNITVSTPEGGQFDFGILQAKSKISPEVGFGKLNIRVEVTSQCSLSGETVPQDFIKPENIKSLENKLNRAIRKEITAALGKSRQLDTDLFGFGEAIHQKYPKEWRILEPKWAQTFRSIPIQLKIKVKLTEFGLSVKPLVPK